MRPLLAAFLAASLLAAQAPRPQPAQTPQYTFTSHAWLVLETVTVQDTNGEPVTGLTAKDFTITEDNVPQKIAVCEYQRLDGVAAPAAPRAAAGPAPAPPVTSFQITPESPGRSRYADRRLVALYFDMTAMPVADQLRALDSARRFVAAQMRPADMMAVLSYAGAGVKVKQDFTADRDALLAALGKMILATGLGLDENGNDAASADTGSAFGQDDSEFNIFNTNRQLAALQTAVDMLAPLSEKKSLVYFASGINLQGVDNQAQLEATTNAAIRANVALFPVDARGLVAGAPLGDATHGSPGGVGMYNGAAASATNLRLQASQDTLYALGSDTGGKALLDTNDLASGIAQARNAISSYYILGYYTSNPALDGRYRRLKVALAGRPGARLAYRTGYYAGKAFAKFTAADKERQLEDALMLGDPITELTLQLEVNYFELNTAEYFVPIAAKLPGSELALAKKGGAQRALIDFIGEVKDDYGTTVANLRDKVELKLSGKTAEQLAQLPIEYTTGFTLLPGKYSIKLLARDDQTGRIGTYLKDFTIPNLMRVADRLPMSSVVLSAQRAPLAGALFNAKNSTGTAAQAANPLIENGRELMPSVTRVFHRGAPIYAYVQAYEHPPAAPAPLEAYVGFYPAAGAPAQAAWTSPPQAVIHPPQGRAGAVPIEFTVPAGALTPGTYVCQVTLLDPATQKANFWRSEILVQP
ncbi:MAG TPA: VWA domain-containing protein [Terriglobales bacterium]|nr:VWA domain-containing protein [Terriglobales bacterium]